MRFLSESTSLAVTAGAVETNVGVGSGPFAAFIAAAWDERLANPTDGVGDERNTE